MALLLNLPPLLPKQILLTNLLTDVPEMTVASDNVDPEGADRPRKWDIAFLRRFMVVVGLVSSFFDYATFGLLLWFLRANQDQLRTGWFLESVVSAPLVVLVVRSRRPFFRSRPGRALALATGAVVVATLALASTPLAGLFEFVRLPATFFASLLAIVVFYGLSAEAAKHVFYRFCPVGREGATVRSGSRQWTTTSSTRSAESLSPGRRTRRPRTAKAGRSSFAPGRVRRSSSATPKSASPTTPTN